MMVLGAVCRVMAFLHDKNLDCFLLQAQYSTGFTDLMLLDVALHPVFKIHKYR